MGKNQSKAGGSIRFSARAKRTSQKTGRGGQFGSLESLSTAVSLSSHADRCLLRSYGSLDNLHMYEETGNSTDPDPSKKTRGEYQLLDTTSSEREELTASDDHHENESSSRHREEETDRKERAVQAVLDKATQVLMAREVGHPENGSVRVPNGLLEKLTEKDWSELVSFMCSFMEQSLQSSITEHLKQLQSVRPTNMDTSGSSCEEGENQQRQQAAAEPVKHRRRSNRKSRPLSMPAFPHHLDRELSHRYHHSHKHTNKNSTSPVDISLDDNCPAECDRTRSSSSPHSLQCSNSPLSSRHKSRQSSVPKTATVDTTTQEDFCAKLATAAAAVEHEMTVAQGSYLTLAQLKDLGLSLRRDHVHKNPEDNSQFSMQCWPSTEVDYLMKQRRQRPRRRKSRKGGGQGGKTHSRGDVSHGGNGPVAELENLYTLGPDPVDSGRDSPATNMAVADESISPPLLAEEEAHKQGTGKEESSKGESSKEESPPCYGVMHLHQHNYHHFHHVIHHSLSQPSALPPSSVCISPYPEMPISQ